MVTVCAECLREAQNSAIGIYCSNKDCPVSDGSPGESHFIEVSPLAKRYALGRYLASGEGGDGDFIECGSMAFKKPR